MIRARSTAMRHATGLILLLALSGCSERPGGGGGPIEAATPAVEPEERRAEAVETEWDLAQRRGIDFRAIGADPAWTLEIDAGKDILLMLGSERLVFPGADVTLDMSTPRKTITSNVSNRTLVVELDTGTGCREELETGQELRVGVTLTLDGRTFRGCGRGIP